MTSEPTRLVFLQNGSLFDHYGGIEYYLDDLATLCGETFGFENVWAILPRRVEGPPPRTPYRSTFVPRAGKGWRAKLENRFSPAYFARAREAIRRLKPSFLVNGHVSLGPLTYALSRLEKIPYLTVVYGIECWGALWPQDELSLRAAHGILSISHWTKKVLVERGYDGNRVHIIQPRLATAYERTTEAPEERTADGPFILLTVSRLDATESYKGHDHVIQALALLKKNSPDLELRYVIQGGGSDRERLEKLTKDLDLGDRVDFRNPVNDRKDLDALYRTADVFVMPSRYGYWDGMWRGEGFGIVYLEAASFGLPSVAYDCGGATDFIRHGETGRLVRPDDIDALAATIGELARNRPENRRLGRGAFERVMRDFTRPAIRRQLEAALSDARKEL